MSMPESGVERSAAVLDELMPELERAVAAGPLDPGVVERVLGARSSARNRFMVYRSAGELLLRGGHPRQARTLAIRSLTSMPRYGAAFRLLGTALEVEGRTEEASMCHRYQLPEALRDEYFADSPVRWRSMTDSRDDVRVLAAFAGERIPVIPARGGDGSPIREMRHECLHSAAAQTIEVAKGRVWFDTFNTIVWDAQGAALQEVCRGYAEVVQASLTAEAQVVPGTVCVLGNRNADNYYHWMNDVLPRLGVLQASGIDLDSIERFLLGPIKHPFQFQTLASFGIGMDRLLFTDQSEHVVADRLLVPMFGSNSLGLRQGRWLPAWLSASLCGRTADAAPKTDTLLYVSRGTEGARGVVNEPALIEMLTRHGFTVLRAEMLSVAEQALQFAGARVVLGPHGAGLTNIVFCKPGARLIEFYDAHIEPCFWALAATSHLRYEVVQIDPGQGAAMGDASYHRTHDQRRDAPMHVDVGAIEAVVARACAEIERESRAGLHRNAVGSVARRIAA